MKHTSIVTPNDLARYADARESQGVIPELIYLLIKQSAPDISECRIPYGDAVNQPGMDGIVDCETGFLEFVPAGKSYGREERELAKKNQEKAKALDAEGFTRFAAAMRKFAEQYTKEAEVEEKRDIYEEYD